ncbi:MAG TPA: response regulator transcription factor [Chthoniobacteraceae bacterium]|jgi:DNA-binding NarL/FixJ family response regulator
MTTKILLIEDEPQMRENLETILELEGFAVVSAADGNRGLQLARSETPHVILCDITMPGLDGYEVLAALRADPDTATIPFLFLTAKSRKPEIRTGMNLGADDYLTKPISVPDLLGAIQARLRRAHEQQTTPTLRSPDDLLPLGLTPREAEVLYWVSQGKTNPEIGLILAVSVATVKKHVEHIFEKIGVENRSAAILRVIDFCGRHEG